jgi:hypothetical protein
MLKTKNAIQTKNRTANAIRLRQPVGTSHFQFRDHQFFGGAGGIDDEDGEGGVGSMKSFACQQNLSRAICIAHAPPTFSTNHRESRNEIPNMLCGAFV